MVIFLGATIPADEGEVPEVLDPCLSVSEHGCQFIFGRRPHSESIGAESGQGWVGFVGVPRTNQSFRTKLPPFPHRVDPLTPTPC